MNNGSEWTTIRFGDLVEGHRGVSYQPHDLLDGCTKDSVVLLRANNIQQGRLQFDDIQVVPKHLVKNTQYLLIGDIAVCMSNGSKHLVGKSAQLVDENNFDCTIGAFCSVFRPKGGFDPKFVKQLFLSNNYQAHIDLSLAGSAINNLKNSDIESIIFRIPSKPCQKKISEILCTIDRAITHTEALIEKYQQIKAGLMHDLFTRGIGADGKLRPPRDQAPEMYRESSIGWIPKEWKVENILDVVDFPNGQVSPLQYPYIDWILVAPDHIERNTGKLLARVTARDQGAISGKYVFDEGDIVYSKIRPYLRKAILANFYGLCSADMYPLKVKKGNNSTFVLGIILGEGFSRYAESVSMRSGFPKINRSEFSGFECGIPNPGEQDLIATIMSSIDLKIISNEKNLEKLIKQKSGLMNDLLTGKVQVNNEEITYSGLRVNKVR
jgi:type I restriction enzyme, S subunit